MTAPQVERRKRITEGVARSLGPLFDAAEHAGDPPFLTNPVTELERRFGAFHYANPAVYGMLEELALRHYTNGRTRIGIAELVEDLRYDVRFRTQGAERFKINNSHRAFYARLLIHQHSKLASVIGVRRQTHYEGAA